MHYNERMQNETISMYVNVTYYGEIHATYAEASKENQAILVNLF